MIDRRHSIDEWAKNSLDQFSGFDRSSTKLMQDGFQMTDFHELEIMNIDLSDLDMFACCELFCDDLCQCLIRKNS